MDTSLLSQLTARGMRFIFPALCPLCSAEVNTSGLCSSCWTQVQLISANACTQCGIPFAHDQILARCGNCLREPPEFDAATAAMVYNDTSRQLVLALKYGDRQDIAPVLARMMRAKTLPFIIDADLVMPLPLHPTRFFSRRFNQSAELCRHLLNGTPHKHKFCSDLLLRSKKTPSQGRKTRQQRHDMMRGAFEVPAPNRAQIKDKHIVLIDDVLTTGASLSSAARALKKAGANKVSVSVAARVC